MATTIVLHFRRLDPAKRKLVSLSVRGFVGVSAVINQIMQRIMISLSQSNVSKMNLSLATVGWYFQMHNTKCVSV